MDRKRLHEMKGVILEYFSTNNVVHLNTILSDSFGEPNWVSDARATILELTQNGTLSIDHDDNITLLSTLLPQSDLELICKHCGRMVLAGPPCCYDHLYDLYQDVVSQNAWLRKIQSKQAKQINDLHDRLMKNKNGY